MTRDEAREYFKKSNLTYEDIDMNNIYKLIQILNKKIAEANSCMLMINEPKLKGSYKNIIFKKGKMIFTQIKVKGNYFDSREAITFNEDGFIGFCGWASDDNTRPFIDGFIEWCDYLKNKKLGVKMNDRYLFRGFHKVENGKETIYIDGFPIKGKWVLGDLVQGYSIENEPKYYIVEKECFCECDEYRCFGTSQSFVVILETIGQYCGLDDKNGKKIFENDVVKYDSGMGGYETSIVYYDEYQLSLNIKTTFGYFYNGLRNLKRKKILK